MDRILPEELLVRIFRIVSIHQEDIAACRAVCRTFSRCSSNFLIPRIVIAKRYDVLKHVHDMLLLSDDLLDGITELVYDTSYYTKDYVLDPLGYYKVCGRSERDFRDKQCTAQETDYTALCHNFGVTPSPAPWHDLNLLDAMLDKPTDIDTRGTRDGFERYLRECLAQTRIEKDLVHLHALQASLKRLRNLRRVVFTDFRELAKPGEDYARLCNRLFGNSLEPVGLSLFKKGYSSELSSVLNTIAETPNARIEQFQIGGHPFERWKDGHQEGGYILGGWIYSTRIRHHIRDHTVLRPDQIPSFPLELVREPGRVSCAFPHLTHLSLPISVTDQQVWQQPDDFRQTIQQSFAFALIKAGAPTLTQLSLMAIDLFDYSPRRSTQSFVNRRQCLDALVFALDFPRLRQLELRGWSLPEERVCQEFLSRHADVLSILRLDDCNVWEDPYRLARWAGTDLRLDGVSIKIIYNVFYEEDNEEVNWTGEDIGSLWLNSRTNCLSDAESSLYTHRGAVMVK